MHEATGELRTEVWMEDDGPALLMYDRNGQERLALFVVHVQTYANGKAAITVTGKGCTLTLDVFTDGPTIAMNNPERGQHPLQAAVALKANGHLRGFFVKKPEDGADKGHLVPGGNRQAGDKLDGLENATIRNPDATSDLNTVSERGRSI